MILGSAPGRQHRGQRAGQYRRQDLGHEGQAVALVRALLARAAERQLVIFVAVEDGFFFRDRVALLVRDPAGQQRRAQANGQPDLVAGDRGGGGVEEHRRLTPRGRGDGDRVGAEQRLGRERGHDAQPGAGEADADHVLLGGLHREVADGAEVAGVVHGDHADADGARLLDGQPHRLRSDDDAEPPLAVDHRGGGRLPHDAPSRPRIELAGPVVADVGAQHVRHAVRLDAAQVGHRQHVRRIRGVVRAHAELLEDLGDRPSQRRFRDEDLVLLGYLEALEDHGRLLSALEDTPRTGVMEALAMS